MKCPVIFCLSVLLRLGLQLILHWLKEVFNDGINQIIQFFLQVCHITDVETKKTKTKHYIKTKEFQKDIQKCNSLPILIYAQSIKREIVTDYENKYLLPFRPKSPDLCNDLPVTRSSTELSVVLDFWFSTTGPHSCYTSVGEGKGDHLTGTGGGQNLRGQRGRSDNGIDVQKRQIFFF